MSETAVELVPDEQIVKAMREIVAEKGRDYVYVIPEGAPGCMYRTRGGGPSCVVGHVIDRVEGLEYSPAFESNGIWAREEVPLPISSRIREALGQAQRVQDDGRPWGEALNAFERELDLEVTE